MGCAGRGQSLSDRVVRQERLDRQGSGTVGWAGRRPNLWAGTGAEGRGGVEAMASGSRQTWAFCVLASHTGGGKGREHRVCVIRGV